MAAGSPPLPAQCGVHRAIADGVDELGVVAIVLAGVVVGELRHRCVERSAVADVGVNRRSITCCRMGAGEYSTTFLGELAEPPCDVLGRRNDLHVAELADVEVDALQAGPTDEDVGRALNEASPNGDTLTVVRIAAGFEEAFVDRRPGLFDLQEEKIVGTRTLEQEQMDAHPDASDPHDLAEFVDERVTVEEVATFLRERRAVRSERALDDRPVGPIFTNPKWGRLNETSMAVDNF